MTKKELSQYHFLNIEITHLQSELIVLEAKAYKSMRLSDTPHGTEISDCTGNLATQIADLQKVINDRLFESIAVRAKIQTYINSLEDTEIRVIYTLRYIDRLPWREIGKRIGYDGSVAFRKAKEFNRLST